MDDSVKMLCLRMLLRFESHWSWFAFLLLDEVGGGENEMDSLENFAYFMLKTI